MQDFFDNLNLIDSFISQRDEPSALLEEVVPLIQKNDVASEYFYNSLADGSWIEYLSEQGLLGKITTATPRLIAAATASISSASRRRQPARSHKGLIRHHNP